MGVEGSQEKEKRTVCYKGLKELYWVFALMLDDYFRAWIILVRVWFCMVALRTFFLQPHAYLHDEEC